ncbi:MAG: ATP12 family protein [Sphingomicrobium sp.]
MKRFWTDVAVAEIGDLYSITLDRRAVRTPARAVLRLPTRRLAEAISAEWAEQGEEVDPRVMPLTGLANAAIDGVAADPASFAATLTRYAEADLLCYRADHPPRLVERQAAAWDPLLDWARRRYDVEFVIGGGVIHLPQPEATVRRLAHEVATLDTFRLAALSPLVTIGGSLVAGLAITDGAISAEDAWSAVSIDEQWQIDEWGKDSEAQIALDARRRDFLAAARLLALLD